MIALLLLLRIRRLIAIGMCGVCTTIVCRVQVRNVSLAHNTQRTGGVRAAAKYAVYFCVYCAGWWV